MREYNLEKQHKKGKLHAIERIQLLLDKKTFHEVEIGKDEKYDGVISGYGKINGSRVYIYAQDFTYKGGTLGEHHGAKISHVMQLAIKNKVPIIGILDSGGARILEGVNALAKYGDIFYYNTMASGYIPQISIISGPCAGGAVYSPGITDFIFMVDHLSNMFVTGPKVIKSVTNEVVTADELGGVEIHNSVSGVAHQRFCSEVECYKMVRELLNMIPHYYGDKMKHVKRIDVGDKDQSALTTIIPDKMIKSYNMENVINVIFDDNSFIELQPDFAKNIIIGLAKLGGITVGIVANQPCFYAGVLDCDSSDKASRFVRYCDSYDIPIITLTDVPGFMPGVEQEKKGVIRHGAKLLYAYAEATTIKLTVVLRKAYGGAYIAMSSKHLKADRVYAWEKAEIAVMGAEGAVEILYAKNLKELSNTEKEKFTEEKLEKYKKSYMNVNTALAKGYVDLVIEPESTRKVLFYDLIHIKKKIKNDVVKKHGNIPL